MEEETKHLIDVLEATKKALIEEDVLKLKDLSNQTIHTSSTEQQRGEILVLIINYTLEKLIERKATLKIKNWNTIAKRINSYLDLAVLALKQEKFDKFEEYLVNIRKTIESISINLKPYIKEVLRKASVNKASKIYEHGISMEQTAHLLGVTQWELSEYTGQTAIGDIKQNLTIDVKKRAQRALEFFS